MSKSLHRESNSDLLILGDLKALMPADSHTVGPRCITIKIYLNERNTVAETRNLNLNEGHPLKYYASLVKIIIHPSEISTRKK